jgi:hypothetical protein
VNLQVVTILFFCFSFAGAVIAADIVMNAADVSHPFYGFGAQIWPGDLRVESLTTDLNLKYFRIAPGGCPTPPTDATVAQMDAYVNSQYNGTSRGNNVTASLQMAANHNVAVIFVRFGGPAAWLGSGNRLLSQYFDDYARLWASEVYFFRSRGLRVDYVELFNEPEGDWNIYCPGADYNTVVKLVRAELDSRGLTDVGIVGPGLAYLYHGPSWIGALDTQGKAALAAWSTHAWDEGWGNTAALPSFLDQRWKNYFGAAVNSADPTHSKPIIVTEYASGVCTYNGVTYSTDTYGDTYQFAQRCYENSLTLANNGANVLCYWEAANQSWQSQPMYAFMRINSTLRPTYYVFSTLAPFVQNGSMVLNKTWNDPVISAAGFVSEDRLVLAFANSSADTVTRSVQVTGVTSLAITNALAFISGNVVDKLSEITYDYATNSMNISLPRESTLTVVMSLEECAARTGGDLNGDCKVTFADFAKAASDWMTDNRSPQSQVIEDFESYSDSASLTAKWVPTANVTLTLDASEFHSGGKSMKYQYNNANSPWYSRALHWVVGNGIGVDWSAYDTLTVWFKCTVAKEPLQVNIVNKYGTNVLNVPYGTPSVGGWTRWDIDLTPIAASEKTQIGRVDIFFTANYYGAGTAYFDDISVSNSGALVCSQPIEGDVDGNCVVDFSDIKIIGDNWLNCTLIEQSECW